MDNFNVMPSIAKEQNPIKMKNINSWNAQVTFNLQTYVVEYKLD